MSDVNDMSGVIVPRSDQISADDLLAGPLTIKITKVGIVPGEQPVTISYEGDGGRTFKPCKSMARIMVALWGADASTYAGRSMTLYRDPSVKWGGLEVGGIRISHMTDIAAPLTLALTQTRGKKQPFTVRPLVIETAPAAPAYTGPALVMLHPDTAEEIPCVSPKQWATRCLAAIDRIGDPLALRGWARGMVPHFDALGQEIAGPVQQAMMARIDVLAEEAEAGQ